MHLRFLVGHEAVLRFGDEMNSLLLDKMKQMLLDYFLYRICNCYPADFIQAWSGAVFIFVEALES